MTHANKVLLCILDGFGIRAENTGNATLEAKYIAQLLRTHGTLIKASGTSVGLEEGQFGNSEVGHTTIGAGRVLQQKLPMINSAIRSHELAANATLRRFLSGTDSCHLMILFSAGGVHSHVSHLFWAVRLLREMRIRPVCHLILDGRDVGYRDGLGCLENALASGDLLAGEITTIQGRFYAMDRDNRHERTQAAYDLIARGQAKHRCDTCCEAITTLIREFYDRGINDEEMPQIAVGDYEGAAPGTPFWSLNFRVDRVNQILSKMTGSGYRVLSFASCEGADVLFERGAVPNTLGEVLASSGIGQLRVAETEKYAHVTHFFNGGADVQFAREDRILVPSPRVADYATTPEMSAIPISSAVCDAMKARSHEVIIVNFANADMVGHTGDFEATKRAVAVLDEVVSGVVGVAAECGFHAIITADHGNAEDMLCADSTPCKTHTCNPVPFIYLPPGGGVGGESAGFLNPRQGGELRDVAPTVLHLLGIEKPAEMTGESLV